jgi:hypothetical protein
MSRFLAIYNGAADEQSRNELSGAQQGKFMQAWAAWAEANEHALIDPGSPLLMSKVVTSQGVEDFTDTKVGYAIVQADSHDEAVQIFSEHPHLSLIPGKFIEVLECLVMLG